ncbi:hypothetical protein FEZ35_10010 [Lactobacillus delbrueckii subsp. bulgaricus]|uniref:branched-chain amino acid transport system II carrier protein n=1 Tax=Lactobacillus delbrueckii TaxID=1584 RepID=UPI000993E88A|nr:branched-chain amino acid transport system II carrier protein [Lactobacillus delbrueckii]ASW64699.1 hypothetical protein LDL34_10610 [Lactobacillus delbrueckii subsp. lactis]AZA26064.1 MAG: hypothetical protein DF199_10810 [Lactobacillus delbrueckii subsp. lactis]MCD5443070.1 branched-chain amino acid transport system II carrier protein [Lactobacillus delbrueckii subsp. lactis]MCD5444931.1 branched-chain amino acid transport system II carrier protein [Lactobacillus delbrueckii subsp. lactis]
MGATSSTQASADYLAAPLTNGFLQGYNTLDALAALDFGITVVTAIKGFKIKEGKETSLALAKTGAIGFAGIAIIYLILISWLPWAPAACTTSNCLKTAGLLLPKSSTTTWALSGKPSWRPWLPSPACPRPSAW